MSSLPYLDIHTHGKLQLEDSVSVYVLSYEDLRLEHTPGQYSCGGIHPWWLEEYSLEQLEGIKKNIENLAKAKRLWAIGETGIDRLYPEFLEVQRNLFDWHWNLAEEFQLPLVIHNVRAGSDFLELLKKKKSTVPWLFHDFRGNEQLVRDLLRLHSESYFSFGLSLDNSPQVRELIPAIPIENIFLETDNQKHLDIHDIYVRASEQLKIDVEYLKSQLWHNFKKLKPEIQ